MNSPSTQECRLPLLLTTTEVADLLRTTRVGQQVTLAGGRQ